MSKLEVGFAKTDITPRDVRHTLYHHIGDPMGEETPIRDDLFARATAFRVGGDVAIWVTADLLCVSTTVRNRVIERLAEQGLAPERVALCATHTHTAPSVVPFHGRPATPDAYLDRLADSLVGVATEALQNASPATIGFAKTEVDLNVNRREIGRMSVINDSDAATGLVDDELLVAKVESEAGVGLLLNYAAHPLTMSERVPQISADFPGRTVGRLEADSSTVFAQFLQGCAGNLNMKMHGDEEQAEQVGGALAEAVAMAAVTESDVTGIRMAAETVRLPWGPVPTVAEAEAILGRERSGQDQSSYGGRRCLDWAEDLWETVSVGDVTPYKEVTVQAMRLGDAVFVSLPGEVFVEIGLAIKERVQAEHVFVVAYANNCEVGYVPTAAAFGEGGYEVDAAPYYYGVFQLSPDCERIYVEAACRLAARVL